MSRARGFSGVRLGKGLQPEPVLWQQACVVLVLKANCTLQNLVYVGLLAGCVRDIVRILVDGFESSNAREDQLRPAPRREKSRSVPWAPTGESSGAAVAP